MGQIVQMNGQNGTDVMETQSTYEVQTPNASYAVIKATIDSQIATARAFPRSVTQAVRDIETMACQNQYVAKSCTYSLPRGGKNIEGPSARFAEILASCWGNLRVQGRVVEETDRYIVVTGECIDLQRNNGRCVEVRRNISGKFGKYNDDMIAMTANAAISIATRNAIFQVIPRALWESAYQKAREVMVGKMDSIEKERSAWLKFWADDGISEDRVFAALGVKGVEDVTVDHIITMSGWDNAIKSGELSMDELFPRAAKTSQKAEALTATLNAAKDKTSKPKAEAKPQELKWEDEPGSA